MKILLNKLKMHNFKGFKDYEIILNGKDAIFYGRNEAGKTTLNDAWLWLTTGKDSLGRSEAKDFKPRDKAGNEIHLLETVVEAEIDIGGKVHVFKKMLKENWVKKRGQEEQEFAGNTAEYWIDEVPCSATEYKKYIDGIAQEETFKMITNSSYFLSLPWSKRREILFKMAGAKSDIEIMQDNPEFAGLPELLNGRTVDAMKKVCKDRISKTKEDIETIPIRIDEIKNRSFIAGFSDGTLKDGFDYMNPESYKPLEKQAEVLKAAISGADKELFNIQDSLSGYRAQQKELSGLKQRKADAIQNVERAANRKRVEARDKIESIKMQINHWNQGIINTEAAAKSNQERLDAATKERDALREEYNSIDQAQFIEPVFGEISEDSFICPTCGRDLPQDQKDAMITAAREKFSTDTDKAREKFETEKQSSLSDIRTRGKSRNEDIVKFSGLVEKEKKDIEDAKKTVEELNAQIPALEAQANAPDAEADYAEDPFIQSLDKQIEALEASLAAPEEDRSAALLEKKQGLEAELREVNTQLDGRKVAENIKARIAELQAEHKQKAQAKADEEKTLFLLEKFSTYKCNLLEGAVNALFDRIRWKLFDKQVNGGIEEICSCTIDGDPVEHGLNNANCINAGFEIVSVLSRYYDVSMPAFFDNAEAVNKVYPTGGQMILLKVTDTDEKLRIEVQK